MLDSMFNKVLSKYEVKNFPDLISHLSKKIKSIKTPENDLLEQKNTKALNPKLHEINEILKANRLAHILNYEYYDEDSKIYQTSRSYGFVLEATTLPSANDKTDDILKGLFNIGIPDGACIQFLLSANSDLEHNFQYWKDQRLKNPLYNTITDERIKFLKNGTKHKLFDKHKIIVRDFRLYITFTFDGAYDVENREFVDSLRNAVCSIFKTQSIEARNVEPEQLINFIKGIMCYSQSGNEWVSYDDRIPIRDQIADPDNNIYVDNDGLVINDCCVRSLSVRKYPVEPRLFSMSQVIGDSMSAMLQIASPFLLSCNIQILNAERTNGTMLFESERVAKQSKNKMGRFLPIIDKKAHEYQLMKQLLDEGEGFVNMGHYLHIFTEIGKSEEACQEAKAVFKSKGWELVNNSNIQLPTLLSSLPLYHDPISAKEQSNFRMMRLYSQTNAVNTLPIFSDWKGTGTPTLMMFGRRGQMQFIDPFDNKAGNYNSAVVATSGAGKSFLLNDLAVSCLSSNSKVWIIDVGRSYKDMCDLLDGQFIEFSEKSKICVNPFTYLKITEAVNLQQIDRDTILKSEDLKDQIEMLKSIVISAAKRDPENKTEDSFVEQAIISAIQQKGNKATFTTVYDELLKLNDDKGRTKDIAESIKSYTKYGIHGQYFEGDSTLDFSNNLIVLELEELKAKGQLCFVVLLILMLKITQEMYLGDRGQKKICIIDEAWDLIGKGNSGSFIETGYRRARKYGGAFLTATQSIDDYYVSNNTQACWNNADVKFLLRQGSEPKNANFDEYTTNLMKTVSTETGIFSEVLVIIGSQTCGVCRLIVDPFSAFIYSSKPPEVELINNIKQYEKLLITEAVWRAIALTERAIKLFNADRDKVAAILVQRIKSHGYASLADFLR